MGTAADKMAWVTRQQWKDWQKRFKPYEDQLMQQTSYQNPSILRDALEDSQKSTQQYFDTTMREQRTAMQDFGVSVGQDATDTNQRLSQLGRTAALVNAANDIRQRIMDRDREIAFGVGGGDREMLKDIHSR